MVWKIYKSKKSKMRTKQSKNQKKYSLSSNSTCGGTNYKKRSTKEGKTYHPRKWDRRRATCNLW